MHSGDMPDDAVLMGWSAANAYGRGKWNARIHRARGGWGDPGAVVWAPGHACLHGKDCSLSRECRHCHMRDVLPALAAEVDVWMMGVAHETEQRMFGLRPAILCGIDVE